MKTYDEVSIMLENIIDEVPPQLFDKLSGGVVLAEEFKLHKSSRPERPLYIMGEYCNDTMGRRIIIYYGSFNIVYGYLNNTKFREKLRHTFSHELRHHVENLSGVKTLNNFDDERLDMYNSGIDIAEFHEPPIV